MQQNSKARIGLIAFIAILVISLSIILFNLAQAVRISNQKDRYVWKAGSTAQSVSLDDGFEIASSRAYSWANDVVLVRVESNWHPQENWKSIEFPPVMWSYVFYSPGNKATATVSIDGSEVYWVKPRTVANPPVDISVSTFPPASGVNVAWYSLLASGGEQFLQTYSNVMVHFVLQPDTEDVSRSLWQVYALTRDDNGHYIEVSLDARTGIIIDSVPSQ